MNQIKTVALIVSLLAVAFAFASVSGAREAGASASPVIGTCLVYVGTYTGGKGKGIYLCRMDLTTGRLSLVGVAAETPNPTFLAFGRGDHFLYAANEIGEYAGKHAGAATAYSVAPDSGRLTLLNEVSSVGSGPCHIVVDRAGKNALVANYGGGSLAVLPIQTDGQFGDATDFIQLEGKSINSDRQEKAHTHCITLDAANRFVFACDLGIDKIMVYRLDAARGKLTPNEPPSVSIEPGSGPRHLTFAPDDRHAYLISELSSTITVFAYDSRHGSLRELQTISSLPADFKGKNSAAEITVHPFGKFLFASNRGDDSITVFAIDRKDGTLTFVQRQATFGKTPRYFGIEPAGKFLVAANQDSGNLVIFTINPVTGKLASTGQALEIPSPVCVKFLRPSDEHLPVWPTF